MPKMEVSVDIICQCGAYLSLQSTFHVNMYNNMPTIEVQPCKRCVAEAMSMGKAEGLQR